MSEYTHIILYPRYSDPSQGKGRSLERQLGDMRKRVHERGLGHLRVDERPDRGKSAYHGRHRSIGELGKIEAEAARGEHVGALFICERLDRLSRQGHEDGAAFIKGLTSNGVTVETLDGDFYDAYSAVSLTQIITSAVKLELAREESDKRSARTDSNWRLRRAHCRKHKLADTLGPPWIIVNEDRTMRLDNDRAALVLRVFRMADAGDGAVTITKTLNRDIIKPWARFKKRTPKVWQRTFIERLLRNRAVTGEYQPMTTIDGNRVPDGEPWLDHFPVAVPLDLFERVNAAASVRLEVKGGRSSEKVVNLFSTLIRCGSCGGKMAYQRGHAEGKHQFRKGKTYSYRRDTGTLICPTRLAGAECPNKGYAYLTFEDAILDNCLHVALDDDSFANKGEVARLRTLIAERQRHVDVLTDKAEALWSAWAENRSDMRKRLAETAETDATEGRANIEALKRQLDDAKGRVTSAEHLARVADIRSKLYDPDLSARVPLRKKVAQAMRQIITSVEIDEQRVATVTLAHGLAAFQLDHRGRRLATIDFSHDPGVIRLLTRGELGTQGVAPNGERIATILRRARA